MLDTASKPPADRPAAGASAATLAAFAASTPGDAIPARVRRRALFHVLDAVGIGFASSRRDFAKAAANGLGRLAADGPVPVFGMGRAWGPRDAAIINGLLCHGLDFDDTHLRGIIHPTVSQFPAALSAAVLAGADCRAMLEAYIVGVEAAVRIASVAGGRFHAAGFHPSGLCNAMGAALACGRLMGLSEKQLHDAQGIALSMASGTLEFLEDGAWTKRLHPGWAAAAGLTAAAMAEAGYVGATAPYSGRFGLYRAFLGDDAACDYAALSAGLGAEWELLQTAIKPYPACHLSHGCIDAAIAIARAHPLDPGEIASVTASVAREMVPTICEPEANKKRPKSGYDAQFSLPFLVATALLKGRVAIGDVEAAALEDREVLRLAAKVGYAVDPGSGYPRHYSGEVVVELRDGRRLSERRQVNTGAPDSPVPDDAVADKFRANAATVLTPAEVETLEALVLALDEEGRSARAWAQAIGRIGKGGQ